MYCNKCGKKIEKDSLYCSSCGSKIEKENYKDKKKNIDKKNLIIIVGVLVLLLIFSLSIFIGKKVVSYIQNNSSKESLIDNNSNSGDYYYGSDNNNGYNNGGYGNYYQYEPDFNEDGDYSTQQDYSFNNVDVDGFISLKSSSDKSVVYIGRASCSYCTQQSLILYAISSKYNLKINYLDISNISSEDYAKLQSSDEIFNGNWGIPLTLIVSNGSIIDKVSGLQSSNRILSLFTTNGLIS